MTRPTSGTRRPALLLGLAASLGCGAAEPPASGEPPRAGERPDVILIVVDTLRADHLGTYGYPRATSPHLDALAERSWVFDRAYSQAPWTTPSIGSLLSSRYPGSLGIRDERSALPDDLLLLPELLRAAGYRTGAVVSHSFCSAEWGFDQGFDSFDESNVQGHEAVTAAGVTDRAIAFLEDRRGAPRFLFAHYFDPHFAYIEHADFPFGGRAPDYRGPIESGLLFSQLRRKIPELGEPDLRELRRLYDSEIAWTDREVGRLLRFLERDAPGAVVALTADHGEEFLDHGKLGHAKQLYEELIRAPLLLHLPGEAPARRPEPVALLDLYPTLAEHLGLAPPAAARGRSLLRAGPPRDVFSETSRHRELRSLVAGDWKLILDLESGEAELYDLARDPNESRDLAAEEPERAAALRARLDAWAAENRPPDALRRLDLDPGQEEHLRALGYL